jgi:hypothetical protein
MIIETEAGEAGEVTAQSHAYHVRAHLLDALYFKLASARLMADAARGACGGIEILRREQR